MPSTMLPIRPDEISVSVNLVLKHKVASIRTRAQLDTEWFSRTEDWVPDSQPRRLFVYLNSGSVGIDSNDLFLCPECSVIEVLARKLAHLQPIHRARHGRARTLRIRSYFLR